MKEIYLYPPRANSAVPPLEMSRFDSWTAQLKYNDTHIVVLYRSDNNIEVWNRHKAKATIKQENLLQELREIGECIGWRKGQWMCLDGGYLNDKHQAIKGKIVLWDVLVFGSELLREESYTERYGRLGSGYLVSLGDLGVRTSFPDLAFGHHLSENVLLALTVAERESVWKVLEGVNAEQPSNLIEGFVFKRPDSRLSLGLKEQNNGDWLVRCRFGDKRYRC
jgi:hypothetical protein